MSNYNYQDETPLSPWAYFGYTILYSIPLVGLIALIINALGATNINSKNYARSYFCALLVGVILTVLMAILAGDYFMFFIEYLAETFESFM